MFATVQPQSHAIVVSNMFTLFICVVLYVKNAELTKMPLAP